MKRGEIWSIAGGPDYAGKPRPAVIVQDDRLGETLSITFCTLTSNDAGPGLLRPIVKPDDTNGLRVVSRLMVDKISTLPKSKIGAKIGVLSDDDVQALDQAMLVFLGLAAAARRGQGG